MPLFESDRPCPRTERRTDERATITLRVEYGRLNTFFADYARNISHGGTFIRTATPLDVGTVFIFVLSVPAHPEQIQLEGEVVHVVAAADATPECPAGMGIRFNFHSDDERRALHSFVEQLMRESLGEHISSKLLATGGEG